MNGKLMAGVLKRFRWWLLILLVVAGSILGILQRWRSVREDSQDRVIIEAAQRYNLHPALVKAVVWRESWFDPDARGTSGEVGLMQIREPAAQDWAKAEKVKLFTHFQLFDPARNTQCGAWYLRRLINRYRQTDNPMAYALAAYNAGPSHVNRWSKGAGATNSAVMLEQMDYPATRRYVTSVIQQFEHYRRTFPPPGEQRTPAAESVRH